MRLEETSPGPSAGRLAKLYRFRGENIYMSYLRIFGTLKMLKVCTVESVCM